MDTRQLNIIASKDTSLRRVFKGVYASNRIPRCLQEPLGIVVNLDEHDKPGSHWVAIYAPLVGIVEYFDSYGLPPTVAHILRFLKEFAKPWIYNECQLQDPSSNVCGHYCITYLSHRSQGKTLPEYLQKFGQDTNKNDAIIVNEFEKKYGKTLPHSQVYCQSCTSRNNI